MARGGPGQIEAIWLKRAWGLPMDAVPTAVAEAGRGLAGSVASGSKLPGRRSPASAWKKPFPDCRPRCAPTGAAARMRACSTTA